MEALNSSGGLIVENAAPSGERPFPGNPCERPPAVTVPDHELVRPIGAGAYGEVWLAKSALGTPRAVKLVYRGGSERSEHFDREFKGLQSIEPISRLHEGLVDVLQIGRNEAAGCFYYVMELADNDGLPSPIPAPGSYAACTLRSVLSFQGSLPLADCVALGIKLAAALQFLHDHGLVHRDLKPSNIIYVNGEPKLADIGLVARIDDARSMVGTAGYIPPEGPGTPQADLYSLGKVLYEAAFGKDRQEFPQLPSDLERNVEHRGLLELNEVILRACECDPRRRYQSAEAMRRELELLRQGLSVRRLRAGARRWRLARQTALWLFGVAVLAGTLVLATRWHAGPARLHVPKRSTNELANQLYAKGEIYLDKLRGTNFALAADCFQRAIQCDTNFARAYASLAAVYSRSDGAWNPGWEYFPKAKELAEKASRIDRYLARPHGLLGCYYGLIKWDWRRAERECQLAIQLDPMSPESHLDYAEVLRMMGRNQALVELERARASDPHSITIAYRKTGYLIDARRFEEALKEAEQVRALDSNLNLDYVAYRAFCELSRYPEAIEAERQACARMISAAALDQRIGRLSRGLNNDGARGFWKAELENATDDGDTYAQAWAYAQLGRTAEAIDALQELLRARSTDLTFHIMTDSRLDGVRSDARFLAILRTMHLE